MEYDQNKLLSYKEDRTDKGRAGAARIYACGDRNFGLAWDIPIQADVSR